MKSNAELIKILEMYDMIEMVHLVDTMAEILKRMNNNNSLFPEKKWEHRGPLC